MLGDIRKLIRPADYVVLGFVIAIITVIIVFSLQGGGGRDVVYIQADSSEYYFSLGNDELISLAGPVGETVVEIAGEQVRVVSSPGRRQLCVLKGAISETNEWLICLPNRVLIRIVPQNNAGQRGAGEQGGREEADGFSY